jgi:hypothetical protein
MSIFTAAELPTFLDIELLWRKRNIKERLFCQEEEEPKEPTPAHCHLAQQVFDFFFPLDHQL